MPKNPLSPDSPRKQKIMADATHDLDTSATDTAPSAADINEGWKSFAADILAKLLAGGHERWSHRIVPGAAQLKPAKAESCAPRKKMGGTDRRDWHGADDIDSLLDEIATEDFDSPLPPSPKREDLAPRRHLPQAAAAIVAVQLARQFQNATHLSRALCARGAIIHLATSAPELEDITCKTLDALFEPACVDHAERDSTRLRVQPIQRPLGQQPCSDPIIREGRTLFLLILLEAISRQRQVKPEALAFINQFQDRPDMGLILVRRIRGQVFGFQTFMPPVMKILHVIRGDLIKPLVTDHGNQVGDRFLAGIYPAAALVIGFLADRRGGQRPVLFQCFGKCRVGHCRTAQDRAGLDGLRGRRLLQDRLQPCREVLWRKLGYLGRGQKRKPALVGQ
ncbi:MAG: hypothetical protein ACXIUW_08535 [Roseinatronobacter sp.]